MLTKASQAQKDRYCMISLIWGIKKNVELTVTESRMVVIRGWVGGEGNGGQGFGQRLQTFSYKLNKFWRPKSSMVTIELIIMHSILEFAKSMFQVFTPHPLHRHPMVTMGGDGSIN